MKANKPPHARLQALSCGNLCVWISTSCLSCQRCFQASEQLDVLRFLPSYLLYGHQQIQ